VSAVRDTAINAIDMLQGQHEEVAGLFDKIEEAPTVVRKQQIFEALADALAVHVTIEERHFYPAIRAKRTDDILPESLEEHLGIKRVLTNLLGTPIGDENFDTKLSVLRELVENHVEEEETDLFPKVELLFDEETLDAIAREMMVTQDALVRRGDPRWEIPKETMHAPDLVSFR
jgi:hypothetical protein